MKTFIKTLILVLIGGLIFNSCEENWLDINEDPNNPSEAPAKMIFPAGATEVAGVVGGYYNLVGGIFSQWYTQANASNQYKRYASFSITNDDFDGEFQDLYAGALNDLNEVKTSAKEVEDWNFYLMATVMECYTYQILVDIYDEIPFTEALQGASNSKPEYDGGELVYDSLIARLDNALDKNLEASTVTDPGGNDLVFNGDMDKWVQFANTLKLKLYLRQRFARPEEAENGITEMYDNNAEFLTSSANLDIFIDEDSRSNPFYESDRRQLNTPNNLRISKTFYDYLDNAGDPRLEGVLAQEAKNGGYTPMKQGNHNAPTSELDPDDVSVFNVEPTDPVYFISTAESYFMQAEVAIEYGLGESTPEELYNNGVQAAFGQYGLDATSFIADGESYDFPEGGSDDEKMKAIMMQKWAGFARFQGIEAWIEWKRTGYPEVNEGGYEAADYETGQFVSPLTNSLGENDFPLRMLFPQSERSNNPNTPGEVGLTQPVWWDKD